MFYSVYIIYSENLMYGRTIFSQPRKCEAKGSDDLEDKQNETTSFKISIPKVLRAAAVHNGKSPIHKS